MHVLFARRVRRLLSVLVVAGIAGWGAMGWTTTTAAGEPPITGAGASSAGIELPAGFYVRETIRGLTIPTDMAFLPDGRILVAEKGVGASVNGSARVRLIAEGAVRAEPVLTLSVNPVGDSGLLSLELDPDFATNGYFYLYYATGLHARDWSGESSYRLARFTFDPETGVSDPASEQILLDGLGWTNQHGGGGLRFDGAGLLYLAVGDLRDPHGAQTPSTANGKLYRIRPTADGYTVPADNPYLDDDDAPPELYAVGLRSPFRMTRQAGTGALFVGDVGAAIWEEVNAVAPGANYGWPDREGPCPNGRRLPCAAAEDRFTDPVLYYEHPLSPDPDQEIGSSVTGLAFYADDAFPAPYPGGLFLADLNLGTISFAPTTTAGAALLPFAANVPDIVDLEVHDGLLYYLVISTGTMGVITHADIDNRAPVARFTADRVLGAAPLTVGFDASASTDEDGDTLAYHWDFGDDEGVLVSETPLVTRTFSADANYPVSLTVVDSRGTASAPVEQEIVVYSGEVARIELRNLTEPGRALYHGGDRWQYGAVRAAGAEGLDGETPYSWSIYFHHNQHSHPVLIGNDVVSDTLTIDTDNHGGDWNLWYRLALTMKTETGQEIEVAREIVPAYSSLSTATTPPGGDVILNGVRLPAPARIKAIVGTEHTLTAPPLHVLPGGVGVFDRWSVYADGFPAGAAHASPVLSEPVLTVTVPLTSTTYTARYRFDRLPSSVYLPLIQGPAGVKY